MAKASRALRISEDFVPVSEFKAHATEWFRRAATTGAPVVVTQNGRPAGVLLSPEAFDEIAERVRFISAIEEGIADSDAGRAQSHAEVARRLKSRYSK